MAAITLGYHNPEAALPTLGDVFNVAAGPPTMAIARATGEVRRRFSEILNQSSSWMMIFELECPTLAHELGDPDRPAYRIDQVSRVDLASISYLGVGARAVRLPPPND